MLSKSKFVFLLTLLLSVGFISTSYISYYVAHESLIKQIEETTLPLTSDNVYSEIQRDLLRPIFISSIMSRDTFVRDWMLSGEKDEILIRNYLKEIQQHYSAVTSYLVSEKTRNYYHTTGIIRKVDENSTVDKWYSRVKKMATDFEINVENLNYLRISYQ